MQIRRYQVIALVAVALLALVAVALAAQRGMMGGPMMEEGHGMMGRPGGMMGGMGSMACPMAMMRAGSMITLDGHIYVLTGNIIQQYDRNLNLQNEIVIEPSEASLQKTGEVMQKMMHHCPMMGQMMSPQEDHETH